MDLTFLYEPAERADAWLESLLHGAPVVAALVIALVLGLRHATDPDHLVAVTSLLASERGDARAAARLGAWWGVGHASVLVALGLPLILLRSELPAWLAGGAETLVGLVIVLLAARLGWRWLRQRRGTPAHAHDHVRGPRAACAIGALHGLAGTGAVVLVLIAAVPGQLAAVACLAVFAPMSVISMTACTAGFAWVFTRRSLESLYQRVVIPMLGASSLVFGLWYM